MANQWLNGTVGTYSAPRAFAYGAPTFNGSRGIVSLLFFATIASLGILQACRSNSGHSSSKEKCYKERLKEITKSSLCHEMISQFQDTFKVMRLDNQYFGKAEFTNLKVDDAVFFNKSNTGCLLIVLKTNNYGLVFGSARIVRGTLRDGKWRFKPSLEYSYDKSYFSIYKNNGFENVSQLAIGSVLTEGEVKNKGCEIDENYWFVQLLK
jgi:hypothetical protein